MYHGLFSPEQLAALPPSLKPTKLVGQNNIITIGEFSRNTGNFIPHVVKTEQQRVEEWFSQICRRRTQ